jgi:MFS family permease
MPHLPPLLDDEGAGPPATRARYVVLLFLCTLALLLYIDRVCIGQAEKAISEELQLSKKQMGVVFAAFTVAYCLFEVPTGHWGDRFGSRGVIARIVLWWSAFTAATGAAMGFWTLTTMRFLFGAGEAGAFPNTARVVTRWFPAGDRGKARGAITTTSLIGGAAAPPIAAYLITLVGWRLTFVIFGLLGVVWAAIFYVWFRDDPAEHPAVNSAELKIIARGQDSHARQSHPPIPWASVLTSPNVWLMGMIMTCGASVFYVLFNWYPTYLQEARHLSRVFSGWLTGLVMLGGALGCICGGWLADWVIRRTGERKWSRRLVGGVSLSVAAVFAALVPGCESAVTASCASALALFFLQLTIPTWWSVVAEISGPHGAALFGLMNSLGGLGAMSGPLAVGWVVETAQKQGLPPAEAWAPIFPGGAAVLSLGVVCWLFVDASRSVVNPPSART